jgi:hypothetical protein
LVIEYIRKHNQPLTHEKYLELAFLGNPPEELPAEEEAELPEEFQKRYDNDEDDLCVKLFC